MTDIQEAHAVHSKNRRRPAATALARERARVAEADPRRSPPDLDRVDVCTWEDEGGAGRPDVGPTGGEDHAREG